MELFRLAHISDVHLGPLPRPRTRQLASKRIIGYTNYKRNRARSFTPDTIRLLVDDMQAQQPDHIAVTGDLVNVALTSEFEFARAWLDDLGDPEHVTCIPGNHDAYVPRADRRYRTIWAPFMEGDGIGDHSATPPSGFPFVRVRGNIALIGLSTAVPSAPFMATGRLGKRQTRRLAALLEACGEEKLLRVILIHHPPKIVRRRDAYRRLTDGRRLRREVRRHGAELVLHGHDHIRSMTSLEGPNGAVPVVGVPAGAGGAAGGPTAAGYALHEFRRNGESVELTVVHRGYVEDGCISETARSTFSVAPPG